MPYYKTCPDCGAHLDPGERCDCKDGNYCYADAGYSKDSPRVLGRMVCP